MKTREDRGGGSLIWWRSDSCADEVCSCADEACPVFMFSRDMSGISQFRSLLESGIGMGYGRVGYRFQSGRGFQRGGQWEYRYITASREWSE